MGEARHSTSSDNLILSYVDRRCLFKLDSCINKICKSTRIHSLLINQHTHVLITLVIIAVILAVEAVFHL